MWLSVTILMLCASSGVTQIFEGSGGDSGPTRELRFVESANDDEIITTNARSCVRRAFSGNGFRLKGTTYNHMFICPNGMIRFNDNFYQNWPQNYGTRPAMQSLDPSLSPYWARVDLSAFGTSPDDSKVRFATYHNETNPRPVVFDKVNEDVRSFTGRNDFEATWVSVVTYENIRPRERNNNYEGKNTFQAVFASNETSWYLMYNYADIDWAVGVPRADYGRFVNQSGHPVMGWNAGQVGFDYRNNEEYRNLPGSGTVYAEDIDDYIGNLGMGRWIFATSPIVDRSPRLKCYDWFIQSFALTSDGRQCPRNERQASRDWRFQRQDKFGRICYARVFPRFGPGLRCCFRRRRGPLLANPPHPGGFLSRNPLLFDVTEDDEAYENCCILSDLCLAYTNLRPKQNGRRYRPRRPAVGYGDPHYSNLDNMNYTFNGCGDFMFVKSIDDTFQIQVRFSRAVGSGLGTVISAVILKLEGVGTVQINHNRNDNGGPLMLLHINGTEYPDYDNLDTNPAIVGNSISIERVGDNQLALVTQNEHSIVVTREPNNLVVVVTLHETLYGLTMGLLGNWSDRMEDDFTLPNGTSLGYPLSDEQIHYDFGESWRLAAEDNEFINTTADADFFCPDDYTPIFVSNFTFPNDSILATATSICGGNINCAFDIAATSLPSFGQQTLESLNDFEEERTITENNAPTFRNDDLPLYFNVTIGETFEYTITAEDEDGDALEFISTGLPPGATVHQNGNNITFRWLVNSTQPFNLSFLAQDTKNASSSSLVPVINVCACENKGVCVQPASTMETQSLLFSVHTVLSCECPDGFIGEFCEIMRDFCQTQSGPPCHPLSNCTNSPNNYTCGSCPSGYRGNGIDCADINECEENTHNCEMTCTNSAGSFVCECMDGYRLDDNMRNCSDINECTTAHDCQDICVNVEGSFVCNCSENFEVDPNNEKNCIPTTPCQSGHSCEQVCAMINTSAQVCSCNRGYTIDPNDENKCVDFNECGSTANLCNQLCINTEGSFECGCLDGYIMGADNFTCEDINECVMIEILSCNTSNGGEICVNLPGTFKCECNTNLGFVLINGICQIPDDGQVVVIEPDDPPSARQEHIDNSLQLRLLNLQSNPYDRLTDIALRSAIANALNSYCNADDQRRTECGLPGHGFQFSESNIFRLPNGTNQDNNDLVVSYYGIYPNGIFNGTRIPIPLSVLLNALHDRLDAIVTSTNVNATIEDVNECEMNLDGCNQFCENTPGSFVCSCAQGYQLDNDMATCIDIDECEENTRNCEMTCTNSAGSFVCGCMDGYRLDDNMRNCSDVQECEMNLDGCNQFCENTPGSFVCSCAQGYRLDNDMATCIDIDECATQTDNCDEQGTGEICRNVINSFVCECNRTLDQGLINGTCQALNGTQLPLPDARTPTIDQVDNAVELIIPNFQVDQYNGQTDTELRDAIAGALNRYCNVNASRRAECGLPESGFSFSEKDVHRIPSQPTQKGSSTSVSYYVLYPNGTRNETGVPVSQQVLSEAIKEDLDNIRRSTALNSLTLAEETPPSEDDESIDWPLALGLSLAGALLLVMTIALVSMYCRGAFEKHAGRPLRYVYDAYRHRPRRRFNVADLEPSFGTFHSMSGETYSGFDEDGLPVDIQTDYDGLSRQARTVSHVPTGSRASLR